MEFNATFLISAISFIVFVFIMNAIFYQPIQKIVTEREKFIDNNFDEAKKNSNIANELISERAQRLESANFEGKTIMENASNSAKKQSAEMISEAQAQAGQAIKQNQSNLENLFNETKVSMKSDIKDLAQEISRKLFGEKVTIDGIDEGQIEQIINEG